MPRDALTLTCPAKVNLALSVGSPRAEDGLHPICSWMVTVDFCDTLKLTRSTGDDSSYEIRIAEDAPSAQQVDWPIESDLAFRAHLLMRQHVGEDLPVDMELIKRIPSGAGLGGGSSNAAGMLTGLNRLFSLGLSDDQLIQLGLRLGSDVGFMVWTKLNNGPAIVSGTGGRIESASCHHQMVCLVLLLPPVQCATNEVYRAFDRITQKPYTDEQRVRSLVDVWPLENDALFNDLAEAAFEVQPSLKKMRDQVQEVAGMAMHLSGSGSAMFIVVQESSAGHETAELISRETGIPAIGAGSFPVMAL